MAEILRIAQHGSERRQRTRLVQVRCTKDEYSQLSTGAESAGLTVGAYVRLRCLGTSGPRATRRPPVERAALAQVLALLGRVASNVNQIARVANTTGVVLPDADLALQSVEAAGTEIMQLLGRGRA